MKLKRFTRTIDPTKKEEILDSATRTFAGVGFKEATIRQICKLAKANVCLISYYFGGKDGLYKAIFERAFDKNAALFNDAHKLEKDIQTKEEFRARLSVYFESIYLGMQDNPQFVLLVHREISEGHPRAVESMKKFFKLREHLEDLIEYGQKKKFLKKDIEAAFMAEAMMKMMVGFVHQIALDRPTVFFPGFASKDLKDKIWKTITTVFFDGVMQ